MYRNEGQMEPNFESIAKRGLLGKDENYIHL